MIISIFNMPADLNDVSAVAAGGSHNLAVKRDGTLVAWGGHEYGQNLAPTSLKNVRALAAGWEHALALKADGTVVAWGGGAQGAGAVTVPAGLTGVVAVAADFLTSVSCLPILTNDNYTITETLSEPAKFYRLASP